MTSRREQNEPKPEKSREHRGRHARSGLDVEDAEARLQDLERPREITEEMLRIREEQMRSVADSLPALIAYVDSDLRYRFNNKSYERMFGRPVEDFVGLRLDEVLGDQFDAVRPAVDKVLSGSYASVRLPLLNTKSGDRVVEARYVPDIGPNGTVRGFYALVIDVTEADREQEHMLELHHEMMHASQVETAGEFAAALAHELNQPLMSILGNSQAALHFLESGNADTVETIEILRDIVADCRRASDIVEGVRGLLRKELPAARPVDVGVSIENILPLIRSDARIRKVSLNVDVSDELEPVRIAPTRLQQVILNLVANAFDAMESIRESERVVTLLVAATEEGVAFTVRDSGPGIAEETMDKIFEPFVTTKSTGLGIGLSMCRQIVESYGGNLLAQNLDYGGAEFRFTLPTGASKDEQR